MSTNKKLSLPVFKSESEEADWWASRTGRSFIRQQGKLPAAKIELKGSKLVDRLNRAKTVQIALRLPDADLQEARRVAECKGIGYQTLLKMLVHEGLQREGKRIRK